MHERVATVSGSRLGIVFVGVELSELAQHVTLHKVVPHQVLKDCIGQFTLRVQILTNLLKVNFVDFELIVFHTVPRVHQHLDFLLAV